MDIKNIEIFLLILPIISFLYASVGHGGASGYLALMAIFSFSPSIMKPTALLLNIFVSAIAFFHFYRAGYFNKNLFTVFAITSIPLAYLGGTIDVDPTIYKKILAILLIFAILKMMNIIGEKEQKKEINLPLGLGMGGGIGFFSGLIGIGGGIILSPIILLMRWGTIKQAAAVSALFIWVNSAAALAGQLNSGVSISPQAFILVIIALIGGFAGAYLGSKKIDNRSLRWLLTIVLFLATLKLMFL